MKLSMMMVGCLVSLSAVGQTTTLIQATQGKTVIGSYASVAAAQAEETARGAGVYSNTPITTTTGTSSTFIVASPSGSTLVAPTTAVLVDAAGNAWGVAGGAVTVNGTADTTTTKVVELAYVSGLIWQESTATWNGDPTPGTPRWWSKTGPSAAWLPAGGTATSPLATSPPTCGPAPASTTATVQCPAGTTGSWTQTTTYASAPYPACWTATLTPATAPAGACTPIATGGTVTRPSYNTGNGLFVLAGKLYDGNGTEFRMRGVDRCHYDSPSQPGISNAKANAVRVFMWQEAGGAGTYINVAQNQHIALKEVPILTTAYFPDGTQASCNMSTAELAAAANWWAANAAAFAPLSKYLMINIANEWGPSNSTTWRDSYISAIATIRKAGFTGPLVVDSGGCGQDMGDLLNYSTAVFASDPQKNIVFSTHIYGGTPNATVANTNLSHLATLAKSAGMAFVVGEFGPGRNIGPSPTLLAPQDVVTAAEANGIGWLAWAWDDNDLGGGASDNNWFSMTYAGPGIYTGSASQLTTYGQTMVPLLQKLAVPATTF